MLVQQRGNHEAVYWPGQQLLAYSGSGGEEGVESSDTDDATGVTELSKIHDLGITTTAGRLTLCLLLVLL